MHGSAFYCSCSCTSAANQGKANSYKEDNDNRLRGMDTYREVGGLFSAGFRL